MCFKPMTDDALEGFFLFFGFFPAWETFVLNFLQFNKNTLDP